MKKIRRILFLRYENEDSFSQWHDSQFIAELSTQGIAFEIFEFPRRGPVEPGIMVALDQALKAPQPGDVLLSCLFDDIQSDNDLFDRLNASSMPSIAVCFDNLQVWYRHSKSANVYDILWITSPDTGGHFKSATANVVYLPYAANPFLAPEVPAPLTRDLVFIGNPYGARALYLNFLSRAGVPVKCYGGRLGSKTVQTELTASARLGNDKCWARWSERVTSLPHMLADENGRQLLHGGLAKRFKKTAHSLPSFSPLSAENFGTVIASSCLVLNSAVVWNTHLTKRPVFKGHLRIFETASAGGLQLIEAHDAVENWFTPGKELITFTDHLELVDLAQFYMDPKQFEKVCVMKNKARQRARAEHCWSHRFDVLDRLL